MAAVTLSVKSTDNNGITYADPAKPDCTMRFRSSNTNKVLSNVSIPNYASEIIINDLNTITVGAVSAQDPLSIRIRTSGALASKSRIRDLLLSAASKFDAWEDENVFQGFRPTTAPVITSPFV